MAEQNNTTMNQQQPQADDRGGGGEDIAAGLKQRAAARQQSGGGVAQVPQRQTQQQNPGDSRGESQGVEQGSTASNDRSGTSSTTGNVAQAGDLTPQEEIRQLRDRLAKFENDQQARDARRDGEDFRDEYIRTYWHESMPRELLRKMLPVTTDKDVMADAAGKLEKMIKQILTATAEAGRIKFVEIGGNTAGQSPAQWQPTLNGDPATMISQGLNQRGGRPHQRIDQR